MSTTTATPIALTSSRTPLPLAVLSDCCSPTRAMSDDDAQTLADTFKALSDPARVKILAMLLATDEVCACDVSDGIGKSAATTSHHLALLRKAGLVTGDKRGTWIWYRAVPERLQAIAQALALKP